MIRYPDHASFHASVTDVRRAAVLLAEATAHADGEVSLVLEEGWTGAAADAFGQAWHDWERAARVVVRDLETLSDVLARVHASNLATDLDARAGMVALESHVAGGAEAVA